MPVRLMDFKDKEEILWAFRQKENMMFIREIKLGCLKTFSTVMLHAGRK